MAVVDPTLFAGKPLGEEYVMQTSGAGLDQPLEPPAQVPQATLMQGDPAVLAGNAARDAANRERATWMESLGASISNWDTLHFAKRALTDDHVFEPTDGYNGAAFARGVPLQLTEPELGSMLKARSLEDSQYRLSEIQDRRQAAQAAGDNTSAGFIGAAIDPAYWVLPGAAVRTAALAGAGRTGAAALGAAGGLGIQAGAGAPVSGQEMLTHALLNAAAPAMMFKAGKGLVRVDPDFPAEELQAAAVLPSVVNTDAKAVVAAVDSEIAKASKAAGVANSLAWNMHKTLSSFGPAGKRIADLVLDNNSNLSLTSVESERAAVRGDLTSLQRVYEDGMLKSMSEDGVGILRRTLDPGKGAKVQSRIEQDVKLELYRRENLTRQGRPISYEDVPQRIKEMADSLDALHARALKEMKAAGVEGAEDLLQKAGWHHREWNSMAIADMTSKFVRAGQSAEVAHQSVVKLLAKSMQKANGWDSQIAYDVAASTINRSIRKGMFEDSILNGAADEGTLKQIRDILREDGVTGARAERVLDALRTKTDDAGKAGFMQHRVDLDYDTSTMLNGERISVTDLIDNRLTASVDKYLDGVSTQVALARKGLTKRSDIAKLREELMADTPHAQREEASQLFDNIMNHMSGLPAGTAVPKAFRHMQGYNRMITLGNSGLWQTTEYATPMAKFGALKAIKYAIAEAPMFKSMLATAAKDKRTSSHLKDILTRHSEHNLRLRPYVQRFEDNFVIAPEDKLSLASQQGQQLVPYINAMKFIHGHQARMTSNLIMNRLEMAAGGDAKALEAMAKYGLSGQVMDKLRGSFQAHKFDVDKWGDDVWAEVRPAFAKMMDESVLHARLGDLPAFAVFDPVGKFMMMYRSFMLTSHNKILLGTVQRDGSGPATMLLAYQFPLAAMAVQAQSVLTGKGTLTPEEMATKAVGQMGGLGIFGEFAGILSGQRTVFGSTGTIPIDKGYKLLGSLADGDMNKAGSTALGMIPLLSLTPPFRAAGNLMKEQ